MGADRFTIYAMDLVTNARRAMPEVPCHDFTWVETLDRQGSIVATLPAFVAGATNGTLEPGQTSLYVDDNGLLRFGGIVWEYDHDMDQSADMTLHGEGHFAYLLDGPQGPRRPIIDRQGMAYAISTGAVNGQASEITFPNASQGTPVDQFNVVADLIAHAASIAGSTLPSLTGGGMVGFDGIRMYGPGGATAHPEATGTLSGVTWARTYWSTDRKGIGQAIMDIAQSYPGFDWTVTYQWDATTSPWTARRYLDLYYPRRGQSRSGVVLEHGGNVWLVKINRSAVSMANTLYGIGASTGASVLGSTQQDPSVVYPAGTYPYIAGTYNAYEEAVQANLDARTRSRLALTRLPVYTITVRVISNEQYGIALGDVSVGDTCRFTVTVPGSGFAIDDWFRIVQQTVKVNAEGIDTWELELVPDAITTGTF